MINPLSQIPNTGNFENHPRLPINDKIANNMPNGLLRIPNIDNSKKYFQLLDFHLSQNLYFRWNQPLPLPRADRN